MITESGSSLNTATQCPKKYEFRYEQRLESPYYQTALGFGSFFHAFKENEQQPFDVNSTLVREKTAYPGQAEAIEMDWHKASAIAGIHKTYWDNINSNLANKHLEFLDTETEWGYEVTDKYTHIGMRWHL